MRSTDPPPIFARPLVYRAEQAAAEAWPAAHVARIGGWQVRLSGGGTRRANSLLPLDDPACDLDAAMDRVEALYRHQNSRSYVMVSSISVPADLDQRLAARGYVAEEPCLLMMKRLPGARPRPQAVEETAGPSNAWMSIYTELLEPTRKAAAPAILATVPSPRAYFLARHEGAPQATALAVLRGDLCIVECVATRSDRRRTGSASRVMDALEAWAATHGCQYATLQVVAANEGAIALYRGRGYAEAGRYHYRWKQVT